MQEQLGENRHLKGKHKAYHPFEDAGIGLEQGHVVVALAESGGGFQSLVFRNVDGAERLENFPFALRSIAVSAPDGRVRSTDNLLLRYMASALIGIFVEQAFIEPAAKTLSLAIPARRSRPRRGSGSDRRAFSRRGSRHRARHEDWRTFGSSYRNLQRRLLGPS